MSRENIDRFRAAAEAFNRGDAEAWLEAFDDEAVFEPQVAAVEGASVGREGVRAFMGTIADLYESFQVDIEEVRDLDEHRVLALGFATGVGKQSGIEQRTPLAIVASFRDGLMTRFKDYGSEDDAYEGEKIDRGNPKRP